MCEERQLLMEKLVEGSVAIWWTNKEPLTLSLARAQFS